MSSTATRPGKPRPVGRPRGQAVNRYRPILLVKMYRHARAGLTNEAISEELGISPSTFKGWVQYKPDVREALKLGREELPEDGSFTRYFYSLLEPNLQELWNQIQRNDYAGGGVVVLDRILGDHGRKARQSLFLHALVASHYSPTRAMEKVGIDKRQLDAWVEADPDFAEMVSQIEWHKGNFFEECLMKLVERGDRTAILFANRSFNARRGYGKADTLNVNVSGQVSHTALDLADLELSQACRAEIAAAVRRREERLGEQRLLAARPDADRITQAVEDAILTTAQAVDEEEG